MAYTEGLTTGHELIYATGTNTSYQSTIAAPVNKQFYISQSRVKVLWDPKRPETNEQKAAKNQHYFYEVCMSYHQEIDYQLL